MGGVYKEGDLEGCLRLKPENSSRTELTRDPWLIHTGIAHTGGKGVPGIMGLQINLGNHLIGI